MTDGNTPFQNILVPVDGSEPSGQAIQIAALMAKRTEGARITLVHVLDIHQLQSIRAVHLHPTAADLIQRLRGQGDKILESAHGQVKEHGVAAETVLREGVVVDQIVTQAKEMEADLVVMGSQGRTGLSRLVMGSVAAGVTKEAPCGVLVVR